MIIDNPFEVLGRRLNRIEELILKAQKREDQEPKSEGFADTYIDQKRVGELLDVSSVTIWDWEKRGILKSYRIGNLKRFKLSEVMDAPRPINRKSDRS